MEHYTVGSSREFFDLLHEFHGNAWIFRGQRDHSWSLLPKVGRPEFASATGRGLTEKKVFESWKRYALHYLHQVPTDEWDWLTLAQHHGLATRMLDWTKNPLAAAFFAVDGNNGEDAAVFAFELLTPDLASGGDPFEVERFSTYFPRGFSARIVSQRGLLSVSPDPGIPVERLLDDRLKKIRIRASAVRELLMTLDFFGVNRLSIYQDLDHLSQYLNELVLRGSEPAASRVVLSEEPFA